MVIVPVVGRNGGLWDGDGCPSPMLPRFSGAIPHAGASRVLWLALVSVLLSSSQRAAPTESVACAFFTDEDPETPHQASEPAPPAALACHWSCPSTSGLMEEPAAASSPTTRSQGLQQQRLHGGRGLAAALWSLVFVGGLTLEEVVSLNQKCAFTLGGQSKRILPSTEDLQRQPG